MLSGEGNAREWWKTTTTCNTLFLYISLPRCFAWLHSETSRNFLVPFYGGDVVHVLVHFFFTATHFHLALVATSISHFVTTAAKFSCCSSNKKNTSFIIFLSLALDLCRTFSHGASLACHILSLFLCLSLALYSEFGDMTINLSLTL